MLCFWKGSHSRAGGWGVAVPGGRDSPAHTKTSWSAHQHILPPGDEEGVSLSVPCDHRHLSYPGRADAFRLPVEFSTDR